MVKMGTVFHYIWITTRCVYRCTTKMSLSTWFYLIVAVTALIGAYCIMHIMCDLWKTIGAILLFAPKLYVKLVNYLMNFVESPPEFYLKRQKCSHHHHQQHNQARVATPELDSSDQRWLRLPIWFDRFDLLLILCSPFLIVNYYQLFNYFHCSSDTSDHDIPIRASLQSPHRHHRHTERQTAGRGRRVSMVRKRHQPHHSHHHHLHSHHVHSA